MTAVRHCRHCWGNCLGDCVLDYSAGMCIHGRDGAKRMRMQPQWLVNRRWWRWVLWGR